VGEGGEKNAGRRRNERPGLTESVQVVLFWGGDCESLMRGPGTFEDNEKRQVQDHGKNSLAPEIWEERRSLGEAKGCEWVMLRGGGCSPGDKRVWGNRKEC